MPRALPVVALAIGLALRPSTLLGQAAAKTTLRDGLEKSREDRAADPAAVSAFARLASAYGTPLYVYDQGSIVRQARAVREAFAARFPKLKIHYAVKANTSLAILGLLRAEGVSAEVVSEGEIRAARAVGIPGSDIMFTSSSKSPSELRTALETGAVLNVDSRDELEQVEVMAAKAGKVVSVSFRINPGVDPHTIHQINTGISESKFGLHLEDGLALAAYDRAKAHAPDDDEGSMIAIVSKPK